MTPKFLAVLEMAVERGALLGIRRFYKHREHTPSDDYMEELACKVGAEVMNSIYEWFDFEEGM